MIRRLQGSAFAPWAGLFLGAAGWFLHHQLGADTNFWDCRTAGGGFVLGVGAVCVLVVAAGGLISWAATVPEPATARQYRQFARWVGVASAATFLLALVLQMLAGALVPACLR